MSETDTSIVEDDVQEARRRILYKYTERYISPGDEPPTKDDLLDEMMRIVEEEMPQDEVNLLKRDLKKETNRIREYYNQIELP